MAKRREACPEPSTGPPALAWPQLAGLAGLAADWVWEQDTAFCFTRLAGTNLEGEPEASADALIGKARWDIGLVPADGDWCSHRRLLEARESFRDLLLRRDLADGSRRFVRVSGAPRFDDHGHWVGYQGLGRDVTGLHGQYEELRRFQETMDSSPDGIYVSDAATFQYLYVNETACQSIGCSREELLTMQPYEVAQVDPATLEQLHAEVIEAGAAGVTRPPRLFTRRNDSRRGWWEVQQRAANVDGRQLIITIAREVTGRVLAQQAEQRAKRLYATLSATNEAIMRARTVDGLYRDVCAAAVGAGGFASASILIPEPETLMVSVAAMAGLGRNMLSRVRISIDPATPEGNGLVGTAVRTGSPCVSQDYAGDPRTGPWHEIAAAAQLKAAAAIPILRGQASFGALLLCAREKRAFDDDTVRLLQRMSENLSFALLNLEHEAERERAEAHIRFLATHDDLTGLPNRVLFNELLNMAIRSAERHERRLAVIFIDLDRFKLINDTLGHAAGDVLLRDMTKRLKAALRDSDVLGRLGGDEFVVLLQEVDGPHGAAKVARRLLAATMEPLTVQGQECRVTASIGISLYPVHGTDEQTLMKNADTAMYLAKDQGKNTFEFYIEGAKTQSVERLALESDLRMALSRDQFRLAYQAKLDLKTNEIIGVEALLRWHHPVLGVVPPNHFIPLSEETGIIVPIGRWVLMTACQQNMVWQRQGLPPISMAVNLSARQFTEPNLVTDIAAALQASGMAPELLELELTETMVMLDPGRAVELLSQLKAMGIRIALDDFGVGYSSLAQIKGFPIDILKVDRSFIRNLPESLQDCAITEAIINMARTLSLCVVAEGVETRDQETFLRGISCDASQGFYFSKPCSADDFAALLGSHAAG